MSARLVRRIVMAPEVVNQLIYVPPLCLSLLGDVAALSMYALAHGFKLPMLRHTLHTLMLLFFVGNMVGTSFFGAIHFTTPGTVQCSIVIAGGVGAFAVDYISTLAISILLFRSLVLNLRPSRKLDIALITIPLSAMVVFGAGTLGSSTEQAENTVCWFSDPWGFHGKFVAAGIMSACISNGVLATCIIYKLLVRNTSIPSIPDFRVPTATAGVMSGVGQTAREDSEIVSRRLVMYPLIVLACAGCSSVATITNSGYMMAVGEFLLLTSGTLNTLVFFLTDPSSRKIARGILEVLRAMKDAEDAVEAGVVPAKESEQWRPHRSDRAIRIAKSIPGLFKWIARE
ncbi:hypothetical protein M427DRAFT_378722 [Gonapodya prolifera JEL478]|uniref:G-protein coupled receptors family 1 profile domain-containing protein n=1 Tax=Gonapodya prolifera (strain JEL478) TaxID=1344416 RepID=A0A139AV07_GONPJ|nr:hypothetical protein M427DRAFT_378722 [Gonapodya prolifera JEL478]|eukprot:KXS20576.1 hypothetical protein M427DRAFT_378722 [Gonapodya prolifera JEL478]